MCRGHWYCPNRKPSLAACFQMAEWSVLDQRIPLHKIDVIPNKVFAHLCKGEHITLKQLCTQPLTSESSLVRGAWPLQLITSSSSFGCLDFVLMLKTRSSQQPKTPRSTKAANEISSSIWFPFTMRLIRLAHALRVEAPPMQHTSAHAPLARLCRTPSAPRGHSLFRS